MPGGCVAAGLDEEGLAMAQDHGPQSAPRKDELIEAIRHR
jgi:hypothetical protein